MIHSFFVIGFNHHQSNASLRSIYTLQADQKEALFAGAARAGLESLIVLNTCNRTELYGYGKVADAEQLFFSVLDGQPAEKDKMIRRQGEEAVRHIYSVAVGLDSQIIGDLEILGQFKQAFIRAKEHRMVNGITERLVNGALRAAKEIRRRTRICSGTVSLSYAAMQHTREHGRGGSCRVLLLGAGKFGSRIAESLHDYYPQAELSICNRTKQKAEDVASLVSARVVELDDLDAILDADVIISSVNDSGKYLLDAANVGTSKKKRLFIDMSIPLSIDPVIAQIEGNKLITLDEVGRVVSETLEMRKQDLPIARQIIEEHIADFRLWLLLRDKSHAIQAWKQRMLDLSAACPILGKLPEAEREHMVRRSVGCFAAYIRERPHLTGSADEMINHYMNDERGSLIWSPSHLLH